MTNPSPPEDEPLGSDIVDPDGREIRQIRMRSGYVCVLTFGFAMLYATTVTASPIRRRIYAQMGIYSILLLITINVVFTLALLVVLTFDPSIEPPPVSTRTVLVYAIIEATGFLVYFATGLLSMRQSIRRAQRTGEFRMLFMPGFVVQLINAAIEIRF